MTQHVEVRFIKNTQCKQTGWEHYQSGMTAHFYAGQSNWLVENGRAVLASPPELPPPSPPVQLEPKERLEIKLSGDWRPKEDYSTWTVKHLRVMTKLADIPVYSKMRKADLIFALERKDNE